MITSEQISGVLKRAAQAIHAEITMRKLLDALQHEQQIDYQSLNELQLRIRARTIAVQALERALQPMGESTNGNDCTD